MMLVSFETSMIAIQISANVRFSTRLLSVNHFFKVPTKKNYSGDIAVSGFSFRRMINTSGLHMAYSKNSDNYWNQNIVNGEYVIAYKFGPWLNQAVKSGLPEVNLFFKLGTQK